MFCSTDDALLFALTGFLSACILAIVIGTILHFTIVGPGAARKIKTEQQITNNLIKDKCNTKTLDSK
jgi:hypothetical protein